MTSATARAHANIALVKYWGKRDAALNLPAAGSLSLTLDALTTTTTVSLGGAADALSIDGAAASEGALARVSRWLDRVRALAGSSARAAVVSENDFPTAAGLASSASAFAALAVAAPAAYGLSLSPREQSVLARLGSGSAARSIFGGLVEMQPGARPDGSDAFAAPIGDGAPDWPLRMVIAIVGGGAAKEVGSRDAMDHCAATSPLYPGWLASVPLDLAAARAAIAARDVRRLGEVAEQSALTMHAAALASRPAILYFQPATLAALAEVRALRRAGAVAYATMDAGPHVKVLTLADQADAIAAAMARVAGVTSVRVAAAGGPAIRL